MTSRRIKDVSSLEDVFLEVMEGKVESRQLDLPSPGAPVVSETEGDLELKVSPDKMTVILRAKGVTALFADDVFALLRNKRIVCGIDKAAVLVAVDRIRKGGGWKGDLVVARGLPPRLPYQLTYPFLQQAGTLGRDDCVWLVDGIPLFSDVKRLFAAKEVSEFANMGGLAVKAVKAGEVIVTVIEENQGSPGQNVYGETVKAEGFPLEIGKNIRYDEAKKQYLSEVYGYLQADGRHLAVIQPFWLSPDRMQVYFINLPTIGHPVVPAGQDVIDSLMRFQIRPKCILKTAVQKLCEAFQVGADLPSTVLVAQGVPPKAGSNARVVACFDAEIKAGALREDDSIDLRERNVVVSIGKGEPIVEKVLPTRGVPGCDVLGKEIKAEDGVDIPLEIGKGIEQKKEEGKLVYFASIAGNIVQKGNSFSVVEVCAIKGDVDYSTGNITVKTDIVIEGSVSPGFTVRADGNVKIKESVGAGALVVAKGNLHVGKGIIGENTRIVAYGDIYAQFVQDAELIAKGNIIIGSYMFNGLARAGGSVVVKKSFSGQDGKVIGGVVIASAGIELSTIGSPTNRSTVVALQADPAKVAEQKKIEEKITEVQELVVKMMRTLQLDNVDPASIRAMIERVSPAKKDILTKLLVNLSAMIKKKSQLENQRKALLDAMDKELEKASVRVTREFFQGNEVQIGSKKYVPSHDHGPCTFQLKEGNIVF